MLHYTGTYWYYLVLVIFIVFIYLVGHFTFALFRINLPQASSLQLTFGKSFLGMLVSVIGYSCFKTYFISYNSIFLLLSLLFYQELKKHHYIADKFIFKLPPLSEIKYLLACIAFMAIAFVLKVAELTDLETGYLYNYELEYDKIFYSNVADALGSTGQENPYAGLNLLDNSYHGLQPYHYFELWIANIMSQFFGLVSLHSYSLQAIPLLLVFLFLAYLMLWERFQIKASWSIYLWAGAICFSTTIFFDFYKSSELLKYITRRYEIGLADSLSMPKLTICEVFLAVSFLLFHSNKNRLALLTLLCLPIVNVSIVPGLLSGLFFFFVFNFYFKWLKTDFLYSIVLVVGFAVIFGSLSILFNKQTSPRVPELAILHTLTWLPYLQKTFIRIVAELARLIALYLPFLVLIGVAMRANKSLFRIALPFVFVFLCGIIFSGLTHFFLDSFQFAENYAIIFFKLFCVVIPFAIFLQPMQRTLVRRIIVGLYFVLIAVNSHSFSKRITYQPKLKYSVQFVKEVETALVALKNKNPYLVGITLLDTNEMPTAYLLGVLSEPTLGGYIAHSSSNSFLINTSWYKIANLYPDEKLNIFIANTPFVKFINKEKEKGNQQSNGELLLNFIKKYQISFAVATANVDIQKEFIAIEQVITDAKSGEKFIILKNEEK